MGKSNTVNVQYPDKFVNQTAVLAYNRTTYIRYPDQISVILGRQIRYLDRIFAIYSLIRYPDRISVILFIRYPNSNLSGYQSLTVFMIVQLRH